MSINIGQIQNLLSIYHKQQAQAKLAGARIRSVQEGEAKEDEDRVIISAEAKRLQIYQKTAEEVLRRLKEDTHSPPVEDKQGQEVERKPLSTEPEP